MYIKKLTKSIIVSIIISILLILIWTVHATSTYNRPWTTPEKSISNGASYLGSAYISKGQYTLYLQRFNVDPRSKNPVYTHLYMSNIQAISTESKTMYSSYKSNGLLKFKLEFIIPIYANMPDKTILPNGKSVNTRGLTAKQLNDSKFEKSISNFPESYKRMLRSLHKEHKNWTFKALKTGLNWKTAVSKFTSTSAIYKTEPVSFRKTPYRYFESGNTSWYYSNEKTTAYYLDPRNFLNNDGILMFETMKFSSNYNLNAISSVLKNTFMSGSTHGKKYSKIFYDAGKKYNINPVHLASRALQEQGRNGATGSKGGKVTYKGKTYKGIYNFFNVGSHSGAAEGIAWASGDTIWSNNYLKISGYYTQYQYTGRSIKPHVKVVYGGKTLRAGTDYKVIYSHNIKVGTASIKIQGRGKYAGEKIVTFKIVDKRENISQAKISNVYNSYAYTGKAIQPVPTVKYANKTLKKGKDYVLSYKNNIHQGTATLTVTGKGNYKGTLSRTFKIVNNKKSISSSKVTIPYISYAYTKNQIKPKVTVKIGNTILKNGTDYTITYKNNINVGTATITVTGKGKYIGYKNIKFAIAPTKVNITSLKTISKKAILKYSKSLGATNYQIAYSTSPTSGFKYITTANVSYTISQLTSRKIYYFKVRGYKKVGNTIIYGNYSPLQSIKIK